jgi:hypothetical protein
VSGKNLIDFDQAKKLVIDQAVFDQAVFDKSGRGKE